MSLKGKRIAICASRKARDITEKIINLGGRPFVEDIVRIEYVPEEEVRDALIESFAILESVADLPRFLSNINSL